MNEISTSVLKKAASGDTGAFEQIMRHYEKLIYSITYRMFMNKEDAEDMLQEVFVKAYKNMKNCKTWKHFKAWLCAIATHTCIDELRRRKNKGTESLDDAYASNGEALVSRLSVCAAGVLPIPEDAAVRSENRRELQNALNKLSEDDKLLIVLRDIEGFTYNETAEIAGLNLGTLKSRLFRARAKLKTLYLAEQTAAENVID